MFLTVNSLISSSFLGGTTARRIELNWVEPETGSRPGDWVGLFRRDPAYRVSEPLVKVNVSMHPSGYFKTRLRFPQNPMLGLNSPLETCLFGYWIAYVREGSAMVNVLFESLKSYNEGDRSDLNFSLPIV